MAYRFTATFTNQPDRHDVIQFATEHSVSARKLRGQTYEFSSTNFFCLEEAYFELVGLERSPISVD